MAAKKKKEDPAEIVGECMNCGVELERQYADWIERPDGSRVGPFHQTSQCKLEYLFHRIELLEGQLKGRRTLSALLDKPRNQLHEPIPPVKAVEP